MTSLRPADDRLGPDTCSVGARLRRDPLVGSAPPARGWLVFEHPGPWPTKASAVFSSLGPQLDARTLAQEVRPMLVRRPGRESPATAWSWWFVDSVTSTWTTGLWTAVDDVDRVLDLVDVRREEARERMTPADPMILVCTHAKHDVCCAVRGRPIAVDLARRWPELVWECSHLGGDRFAGNVAMLPDSTFYGGLEADQAEQVVADHLAGMVSLEYYRGSGKHTSAAQAAVAELLRRHGSRRLHDLEVVGVHAVGDGVWDIDIEGVGDLPPRTTLTVERHWRAPERLTCSGLEPKKAAEYAVRA